MSPLPSSADGETLYLHSGLGRSQLTGYSEQEDFDASQAGILAGSPSKSTGTYNFVAMSASTQVLPTPRRKWVRW